MNDPIVELKVTYNDTIPYFKVEGKNVNITLFGKIAKDWYKSLITLDEDDPNIFRKGGK